MGRSCGRYQKKSLAHLVQEALDGLLLVLTVRLQLVAAYGGNQLGFLLQQLTQGCLALCPCQCLIDHSQLFLAPFCKQQWQRLHHTQVFSNKNMKLNGINDITLSMPERVTSSFLLAICYL